jgi:hypothetical protein
MGGVIIPTISTLVSQQAWTAVTDNVWRDVPGMAASVRLIHASPVSISWNLTAWLNGAYVVTRLAIDGAWVSGTQHLVGTAAYGTSAATWHAPLSAGPHQVTLQYRTTMGFSFDPSADWQTASLQTVAFDD